MFLGVLCVAYIADLYCGGVLQWPYYKMLMGLKSLLFHNHGPLEECVTRSGDHD